MRHSVVDIKEIDRCFQFGISGTGKEVQATVVPQDLIRLCQHRLRRRHDKHIVKSLSSGQGAQTGNGIFHLSRVHKMQFDPSLGIFLRRIHHHQTVQPGLIDIGHDQHPRIPLLVMQRIIDGRHAHRSGTCQDRHAAVFRNAGQIFIIAHRRVEKGIYGAADRAERLGERSHIVCRQITDDQAVRIHGLVGHDRIK